MGITGSWEGWVPESTDIYLYGNNPGRIYCEKLSGNKPVDFTSQTINIVSSGDTYFKTTVSYVWNKYTNLSIYSQCDKNGSPTNYMSLLTPDGKKVLSEFRSGGTGDITFNLNIGGYAYTGPIYFKTWSYNSNTFRIYKIHLN